VTVPMDCQLIGRWRIVEADLWDRAHLDLVEPAMMTIGCHGRGEITFGAMRGRLELEYSRSTVFFTWAGFEELDEVSGTGSAEMQDDGSLEIAFAYHLGDEAILKAVRAPSSTACFHVRSQAPGQQGGSPACAGGLEWMAKRLAGGGVSRRRLNKLSCAGWLPHDRGFVSGLPRSKGRASADGRLITGDEGSPTGPAARQALRNKRCALRSPLLARLLTRSLVVTGQPERSPR
jgi:hypothetical protein